MTCKNILVAVDTTDDAKEVMEAAREFADCTGAAVSAVTVMRPLSDYYANYYSLIGDTSSKQLEIQAVEHANEWLKDLAKSYGIDANAVSVRVGMPAVEIRRLAEELGADLIVIGTHGRHGLGLMLGSTANAVLHGTQCNVLAVKVRVDGSK